MRRRTNIENARQHAQCWIALTALHVNMDKFKPDDSTPAVVKEMEVLRKYMLLCEDDIRKKKISAEAKRRANEAFALMTVLMSTSDLSEGELFTRWAASMAASATLLRDCKAICPLWFKGKHWEVLLSFLELFIEKLNHVEPASEEEGFRIYLGVAE